MMPQKWQHHWLPRFDFYHLLLGFLRSPPAPTHDSSSKRLLLNPYEELTLVDSLRCPLLACCYYFSFRFFFFFFFSLYFSYFTFLVQFLHLCWMLLKHKQCSKIGISTIIPPIYQRTTVTKIPQHNDNDKERTRIHIRREPRRMDQRMAMSLRFSIDLNLILCFISSIFTIF